MIGQKPAIEFPNQEILWQQCLANVVNILRTPNKADDAYVKRHHPDVEILEVISSQEEEGPSNPSWDWRSSAEDHFEDISRIVITNLTATERAGKLRINDRSSELSRTRHVRSISKQQMIVVTDAAEQLLSIFEKDLGKQYTVFEPAFWNSFARIFIIFKKPEPFDVLTVSLEDLAGNLTKRMKAYNVIVASPMNGEANVTMKHICLHCCDGITCWISMRMGDLRKSPESTKFRGNLHQFKLVTAATNSHQTYFPSGHLDDQGRKIYTGSDYDILNILAKVMNFTPEWHHPEPDGTWGSVLPNGTWIGILGRIVNEELNITVTTLSMMHERNQVVDFSMPYDFDGAHMLEAAPVPLAPGIRALSNPFTAGTWGACAAATIAMTLALVLSIRISASFNPEVAGWIRRNGLVSSVILEVINSALRAYPEKNLDASVKVNNTRILLATWSLLSMILTTYYLTVQFTLFVDVPFTAVVDTGEDFLNMPKTLVTLRSSTGKTLFTQWGVDDRAIYVTPQEMAEVYLDKAMVDRSYGLGIFRNVIRNWLFKYPSVTTRKINPTNFRVSKGFPMAYYIAVALQKRSPYTEAVSTAVGRLRETGVIDHLNDYYEIMGGLYEARFAEMSYDPRKKAAKERPLVKLTLSGHLVGAFWILLVGLAFAFLAFLCEIRPLLLRTDVK